MESFIELLGHNLDNLQGADCKDKESIWQLIEKLDFTLPHSLSKLAEIFNDFGLNFDPLPSNSNNNEFSILKHLPDELIIIVAQKCQTDDLRNLCLVSKHMESIARQELYRAVVISTNESLISFCRTIKEEPTFGQYIEELEFLDSVQAFRCTKTFHLTAKGGFEVAVLWSLCLETLKRSINLRRLTIAMVGDNPGPYPSGFIWEDSIEAIDKLWQVATQSQDCSSTTVVLPRLEQLRLIPDTRSQDPDLRLTHPQILKPFLRLPSLSHVEFLNDSGVWSRIYCFLDEKVHPMSK